ncbi:helix-turn-helix domain-containing protein [Kitasatospora purpeofusca]|uniref:helix-turn-helix domain-containing protein n=1 Tax=Kitasatospora purpeofusca TaxID=67352 RepID=UPI003683722C
MKDSLYDRLASTDEGARALSAARLRYEILAQINEALEELGISQAELARRLGIRKSAVNQVVNGDGNMRVSTVAEYLHALGWELKVNRVEKGSIRREVVESRPAEECDDSDDYAEDWSTPVEFFSLGSVREVPAEPIESESEIDWMDSREYGESRYLVHVGGNE